MRIGESRAAIVWSWAACLVLLGTSQVSAQSIRSVVLCKQTNDGQIVESSSLDAVAIDTLRKAGLRVVEVDSALRAQRQALSDQVQAGRVPNELSSLNADSFVSVQLRCTTGAPKVMQTDVRAEYCVLDTKVVATNSGDVVFSHNQPFTAFGLNPDMAIQTLLKKRIPETLADNAAKWTASLAQVDGWEVDLTVARIPDRETGRTLANQLGELPGVEGVRLSLFDRGLAKYLLAGHDRDALERLANAIDSDAKLSLSVTYETARTLHAEFSLAKTFRQSVMAMSIVPAGSELQPMASEIMRSALTNLPYLEMAHTLPLRATSERARELETRLRDKAKSLGVPLVIAASFARDAAGWLSAIKLIEAQSGRTLAAASATAESSTQALDAAVHQFDESFRSALGRAPVRARLGMRDLATELAQQKSLVVQAFKVADRVQPSAADEGGMLSLRNDSDEPVRGSKLTVRSALGEIYTRDLPELAPHSSLKVPVPFDPAQLDGADQLTATISYPRDRSYARVVAVAPLAKSSARTLRLSAVPEDYAKLHESALKERDVGQWQEARDLLLRSHGLYSNAQVLRELAMVELDLGAVADAQKHFSEALSASTLPLDVAQRSEVTALLAQHQRTRTSPMSKLSR
jgi:tetratricopeptide (TPR) repeat protein